MKKFLSLALAAILTVTSVLTITASARNVGDVIGETLYTDIVASIDGHNIASYNYNGNTMIVAEDLRNYGFDVTWNPTDRTLTVDRDCVGTEITSEYTAPKVSANILGTKSYNVLYTDIKTYVCSSQIEGYNIGGLTVINFNSLAPFGNIVYNNDTRTLDITLNHAKAGTVYNGKHIPTFDSVTGIDYSISRTYKDDNMNSYLYGINKVEDIFNYMTALENDNWEVYYEEEGTDGISFSVLYYNFEYDEFVFVIAYGEGKALNGIIEVMYYENGYDPEPNIKDWECTMCYEKSGDKLCQGHTCELCNGAGSLRCNGCGGSGLARVPTKYSNKCVVCYGMGTQICPNCDGARKKFYKD